MRRPLLQRRGSKGPAGTGIISNLQLCALKGKGSSCRIISSDPPYTLRAKLKTRRSIRGLTRAKTFREVMVKNGSSNKVSNGKKDGGAKSQTIIHPCEIFSKFLV